jgi:hypothetical protein
MKDEEYPMWERNGRPMSVKIEFFMSGKSLGKFPCPEMSDDTDRDLVAEDNGIKDYDKFILDDGRLICEKVYLGGFFDSKGDFWIAIDSIRRSGNTTRQIDAAVQELFHPRS